MIATRWAALAVATVPTLAAFGATGTNLEPSALRLAVTAIVGLLASLFWPGRAATAARTMLRIAGWSLAAACLAAIALQFAGNRDQPFARVLPACAMLMLILLVTHALAARLEWRWRGKGIDAEKSPRDGWTKRSHRARARRLSAAVARPSGRAARVSPAVDCQCRTRRQPAHAPCGGERQRSAAQRMVLPARQSRRAYNSRIPAWPRSPCPTLRSR